MYADGLFRHGRWCDFVDGDDFAAHDAVAAGDSDAGIYGPSSSACISGGPRRSSSHAVLAGGLDCTWHKDYERMLARLETE